jgi:glycosyltransferase involved in cell wall biosynthesis
MYRELHYKKKSNYVEMDAMKILYVLPRTVDTVLQNTTENEIARAIGRLGHSISTVLAFVSRKIELDGFTSAVYVHTPGRSLWPRFRFHWIMLKEMIRFDGDVIFVSYSGAHLIPFAQLARVGRKKMVYVIDVRSVPVDIGRDWRSIVMVARYRLGLFVANWLCDGLTVITPMLAETLQDKVRRLSGHIGYWSSGVDLEQFDPTGPSLRRELGLTGKKVIIYHGDLSPNRGIQGVVHAVDILRREIPELVFLIVGDGNGRVELENLVASLRLESHVRFVSRVPHEEIPAYIRTADAGVLPFPNIQWWAVSSPIKLMEYLAIGLPVIATDIAAIRNVIDQTGGAVLASDNKPENLAQAIRAFYVNGCPPVSRSVLEDTISWNKQAKLILQYINSL